jgi:hypothetical protein
MLINLRNNVIDLSPINCLYDVANGEGVAVSERVKNIKFTIQWLCENDLGWTRISVDLISDEFPR